MSDIRLKRPQLFLSGRSVLRTCLVIWSTQGNPAGSEIPEPSKKHSFMDSLSWAMTVVQLRRGELDAIRAERGAFGRVGKGQHIAVTKLRRTRIGPGWWRQGTACL